MRYAIETFHGGSGRIDDNRPTPRARSTHRVNAVILTVVVVVVKTVRTKRRSAVLFAACTVSRAGHGRRAAGSFHRDRRRLLRADHEASCSGERAHHATGLRCDITFSRFNIITDDNCSRVVTENSVRRDKQMEERNGRKKRARKTK